MTAVPSPEFASSAEASPRTRPPLARRRLFGYDFVDESDLRRVALDLLEYVDGDGAGDAMPVVVTPNVDHVVQFSSAPAAARRVVDRSRWCLPDGQPIVWASRILGRPLATRLAGSSLVELLFTDPTLPLGNVVVVASDESIANQVRHTTPNALALVAPHFAATDDAAISDFVAAHLASIVARRPQLVFVGIGFPKDLLMIDALLEAWPSDVDRPVILAVGASFEMLFGFRTRAPDWVQRCGLEWFYRFLQEPRRLFVRYFVRDPEFVLLVAREWRTRAR